MMKENYKKKKMLKPAISDAFHAAWWFMNQARFENSAMPAMKIHALLYLTQGSFAALNHGRMFMPCQFIIHQNLPVEPHIHRLMDMNEWKYQEANIPSEYLSFMQRVWARFDPLPMDFLRRKIERQSIVIAAMVEGDGALIEFSDIAQYFQNPEAKDKDLIKTNDGSVVEKWIPANVKKMPR